MTILCTNGCHVYPVGSLRCQCGAAANGYPPTSGMMYFPGYHPAGYRQAKPDPPLEVSLPQMQGAQRAGASWLSADGKLAYRDDRGNPEIAHWDAATGMYGSWWACERVAEDAVRLEPFA